MMNRRTKELKDFLSKLFPWETSNFIANSSGKSIRRRGGESSHESWKIMEEVC
jgi:hypothetical protein